MQMRILTQVALAGILLSCSASAWTVAHVRLPPNANDFRSDLTLYFGGNHTKLTQGEFDALTILEIKQEIQRAIGIAPEYQILMDHKEEVLASESATLKDYDIKISKGRASFERSLNLRFTTAEERTIAKLSNLIGETKKLLEGYQTDLLQMQETKTKSNLPGFRLIAARHTDTHIMDLFIDVSSSDTFADVKNKIFEATGIVPARQEPRGTFLHSQKQDDMTTIENALSKLERQRKTRLERALERSCKPISNDSDDSDGDEQFFYVWISGDRDTPY